MAITTARSGDQPATETEAGMSSILSRLLALLGFRT